MTRKFNFVDLDKSKLPKTKGKRIDGFRFYDVDGKHYPSVTTVLGILKKEGLQKWRDSIGEKVAQWEMGRESFIPDGRESWSIEVGMVAKTITGAVCDEDLDTSYCICFPKQIEKWQAAEGFVFMATKNGVVKKTPIGDFKLPRKSGKRAIKLDNSDELVGTAITNGSNNLMLISDAGKAVYFNEKDARPMGRDTRGVKGITLEEKQSVIALIMPNKDNEILTVSENGYGLSLIHI